MLFKNQELEHNECLRCHKLTTCPIASGLEQIECKILLNRPIAWQLQDEWENEDENFGKIRGIPHRLFTDMLALVHQVDKEFLN